MSIAPQGNTSSAVIDNGSVVVGGTANGVLYVNSSGNLDSGAVLAFNGTNLSMASGQFLTSAGNPSEPTIAGVSPGTHTGFAFRSVGGLEACYFFDGGSGAASFDIMFGGGRSNGAFAIGMTLASGANIEWSSTTSPAAGTNDLKLVREAAAILQMGADVNGAAVAQTFKAHDGITGTDVAGASMTIAGGRGTGAGTVGTVLLATSTLLGSGTTAQTLTTRVTITGTTITTTLPLLAPDGTAAAPAYSFSAASASDTGIYLASDGNLGISTDGSVRVGLTTSTFELMAATTLSWTSGTTFPATPDLILARDAAGILAQRNSTNAQILRVYNTYTSASVFETFNIDWQTTANSCLLFTSSTGGTVRNIAFRTGGGATNAFQIGSAVNSGLTFGSGGTGQTSGYLMAVSNTPAPASGTLTQLTLAGGPAPTATSTMIWTGLELSHTINYSNGTPGAGQIRMLRIAPVNTALPTGLNAACVFSSTASALGGMHFHNQTDEATNYEIGKLAFVSNVLTLSSTAAGSGTIRNIGLSVADATAQAIVVYSGTSTITGGVTDGYTSGFRMTPTYSAATAQTVTRHNYWDCNDVTLAGAGPAALTNACLVRFNAAAGTHKAVDGSSTKVTVTAVDGWIKMNVNGTIYFVPMYVSKTA